MTIGRNSVASSPERHALDVQKDKVLQELERHGYVAEQPSAGSPGGAICRHPVAPSLVVGDSGRIELLGGQPNPQALMSSQPSRNRIRWRRALLLLALLGVAPFVGLLLVALIVN